MSKIKVLAGDFGKVTMTVMPDRIKYPGGIFGKFIMMEELSDVEIASEENVKKVLGTVVAGAVGSFLLGPLGLVAGALVGGNQKEVNIIVKLNDGRYFVGTTDPQTFAKLQGSVFKIQSEQHAEDSLFESRVMLAAMQKEIEERRASPEYAKVKEYVQAKDRTGITDIQNHFGFDFGTAARFIELLQMDEIIGPYEADKEGREVLKKL